MREHGQANETTSSHRKNVSIAAILRTALFLRSDEVYSYDLNSIPAAR